MTLDDLRKTKAGQRPENAAALADTALGIVAANRAKRPALQALEPGLPQPASGPPRVGIRITLTAYRRKLLDGHDAVAYACKPLTDAIADTLGVDDADPRLTWEYHQLRTFGTEGVAVMISGENV